MAQKYFLTMHPFSGGLKRTDIQARFVVDVREQLAQTVVLQINQDFTMFIFLPSRFKAHQIDGPFYYFVFNSYQPHTKLAF